MAAETGAGTETEVGTEAGTEARTETVAGAGTLAVNTGSGAVTAATEAGSATGAGLAAVTGAGEAGAEVGAEAGSVVEAGSITEADRSGRGRCERRFRRPTCRFSFGWCRLCGLGTAIFVHKY